MLKSGKQPDEFYTDLWKTITSGRVWRGQFQNLKKNGELFWEAAVISPVIDSNGCITHFIAIKEDISDRKNLETQLIHAQKMEAVGQLAAGIAHDFNNILTAIVNYSYLAKHGMESTSRAFESINNILSLSDRAARIVQSLLAFSRKGSTQFATVDVNEVVRHIEKMLSRFIGEDIELRTETHEKPLHIKGDSALIEQTIINLATNARDAMPEGGILSIYTSQTEINGTVMGYNGTAAQGSYAVITVSDTGTGMDMQTRDKLFDPFFTTKEVGKGTGLGLSIAYGIVREHNGFIHVYSEPGEGTTFRIYIPADGIREQTGPVHPETGPVRGSGTILLAEDEEPVRKSIHTILTSYGYSVISAENGTQAVELFTANRDTIDLLLFDMVMPEKNGKDAYEEIVHIKPGIKAIFISGYTPEVIDQKGLLKDHVTFITKPLQPEMLLNKISALLGNQRAILPGRVWAG